MTVFLLINLIFNILILCVFIDYILVFKNFLFTMHGLEIRICNRIQTQH